ncbi:hypothetical protein REPUB_Repub04eG0174400 [Reevesia pubescens]
MSCFKGRPSKLLQLGGSTRRHRAKRRKALCGLRASLLISFVRLKKSCFLNPRMAVILDDHRSSVAKMIRRIVGVAHVEDFESIKEASIRANCERWALESAKTLLKKRREFL